LQNALNAVIQASSKQGHWISVCSKRCSKRLGLDIPYFCFALKHAGYQEEELLTRVSELFNRDAFLRVGWPILFECFKILRSESSTAYLADVFGIINSFNIS
jgi:hypothetical protein